MPPERATGLYLNFQLRAGHPQYLSGKIDQLLGYLTWRDTKCQ